MASSDPIVPQNSALSLLDKEDQANGVGGIGGSSGSTPIGGQAGVQGTLASSSQGTVGSGQVSVSGSQTGGDPANLTPSSPLPTAAPIDPAGSPLPSVTPPVVPVDPASQVTPPANDPFANPSWLQPLQGAGDGLQGTGSDSQSGVGVPASASATAGEPAVGSSPLTPLAQADPVASSPAPVGPPVDLPAVQTDFPEALKEELQGTGDGGQGTVNGNTAITPLAENSTIPGAQVVGSVQAAPIAPLAQVTDSGQWAVGGEQTAAASPVSGSEGLGSVSPDLTSGQSQGSITASEPLTSSNNPEWTKPAVAEAPLMVTPAVAGDLVPPVTPLAELAAAEKEAEKKDTGFSLNWGILPWVKKKFRGPASAEATAGKPESESGSQAGVGVPASAGATAGKPDTLGDNTTSTSTPVASEPALPEVMVPLAGLSTPETLTAPLPTSTTSGAGLGDAFDPSKIVPATPLAMSTPAIIGGSVEEGGKKKKGVNLLLLLLLLIVVVGLGSLVLMQIVNGPVNVNIEPGTGTETPPPPPPPGVVVTENPVPMTPPPTAVGAEDIYYFVVALGSDQASGQVDSAALPAGSIRLGSDYLVPILAESDVTTDAPVGEALEALFAVTTPTVEEDKYRNYLSRAELEILVEAVGDGEVKQVRVELTGTLGITDAKELALLKQQVERTIEYYTFNYVIVLNGEEDGWGELGA